MIALLRTKGVAALAALAGVMAVCAITSLTSSAYAAEGANFAATGHDMDLHCSEGEGTEKEQECAYFKIMVDKVRNGSILPILALDQGTQVPRALANAGYKGVGEVITVNPADEKAFNATPFVDVEGKPLYSVIITASDATCFGCDNNEEGEKNINARAKDFETFFNAGGGIFALAGAARFATYYNFVPLKVGAAAVAPPFEVTPEGEKLGITNAEANCCATHNSFNFPPPEPLVTLEKDKAGKAETIAAFNTTIEKEKFGSSLKTSLSGEGQSGAELSVKEGSSVTDSATLSGEHAAEATGTVDYKVYTDKECKTLTAEAGTVKVTGGVVPNSNPETLAAGTYYWQASYSGDKNNKASKSTCGAEVQTVERSASATCGKTTVGKTKDGLVANRKRVNNGCTLATKSTATELTVYLAPTTHSGKQVLKGIVYADSKGKPGALVGTTTQLTFTSENAPGWYKMPFPTPLKLAAGNYWIGLITGATQYIAAEYFDSVPIVEAYNTNSYTAGPSNPFGSFKTTNEQMSLYMTYTAG